MTPGTEAPAEMHFYFPDHRALCMAENATHTLHNLLTLRGALVRDPHVWSQYLTEVARPLRRRGRRRLRLAPLADLGQRPAWWRSSTIQRDLYGYLHDQTLRMLNQGLTGTEIAEAIELPPALERAWSTHGYYGSVSHNVKAIYQRYLGWFDGNPAHLWQHPPVERATRYVAAMGGADAVVAQARAAYDGGDLRWAVELLDHVVFAEPGHAAARELLADTYEQLGYGSENGTWRNFFLSGATELRHGQFGTPAAAGSRRHHRGADTADALRRPRRPGARAAGVGRADQPRRRAHRHRRALPPPAGQRAAHPQPRRPSSPPPT